jgi:type I restriction enzyme S subunit
MTVDHKPYPAMKASGVSWIGAMPTHWVTAKLKQLSRPGYKTFVDGDWIESPYITTEGIRLIQTGNIGVGTYREKGFRYISSETFEKFRCTEFAPNDVLICRLGEPVGRSCLAPDLGVRMITSVDVCILKPRIDVCAAFLVYVMSSHRYLDWVGSLVRGSTRDRVSRSMLGGFVLPLPPLPEQRAIVGFLDYCDRRIRRYVRAKQKLIALLNEQRGAFIQSAVTSGLDSNVRLKPSGLKWLGDVPEHWEVKRAKWYFQEVDERSDTGKEELLSVSHITGVTPRAEKNITMFMAESYVGHKLCRQGDLVITQCGLGWERSALPTKQVL